MSHVSNLFKRLRDFEVGRAHGTPSDGRVGIESFHRAALALQFNMKDATDAFMRIARHSEEDSIYIQSLRDESISQNDAIREKWERRRFDSDDLKSFFNDSFPQHADLFNALNRILGELSEKLDVMLPMPLEELSADERNKLVGPLLTRRICAIDAMRLCDVLKSKLQNIHRNMQQNTWEIHRLEEVSCMRTDTISEDRSSFTPDCSLHTLPGAAAQGSTADPSLHPPPSLFAPHPLSRSLLNLHTQETTSAGYRDDPRGVFQGGGSGIRAQSAGGGYPPHQQVAPRNDDILSPLSPTLSNVIESPPAPGYLDDDGLFTHHSDLNGKGGVNRSSDSVGSMERSSASGGRDKEIHTSSTRGFEQPVQVMWTLLFDEYRALRLLDEQAEKYHKQIRALKNVLEDHRRKSEIIAMRGGKVDSPRRKRNDSTREEQPRSMNMSPKKRGSETQQQQARYTQEIANSLENKSYSSCGIDNDDEMLSIKEQIEKLRLELQETFINISSKKQQVMVMESWMVQKNAPGVKKTDPPKIKIKQVDSPRVKPQSPEEAWTEDASVPNLGNSKNVSTIMGTSNGDVPSYGSTVPVPGVPAQVTDKHHLAAPVPVPPPFNDSLPRREDISGSPHSASEEVLMKMLRNPRLISSHSHVDRNGDVKEALYMQMESEGDSWDRGGGWNEVPAIEKEDETAMPMRSAILKAVTGAMEYLSPRKEEKHDKSRMWQDLKVLKNRTKNGRNKMDTISCPLNPVLARS